MNETCKANLNKKEFYEKLKTAITNYTPEVLTPDRICSFLNESIEDVKTIQI
jgi:hypothetical protein